jgi:hypothetical protein
MLLKIKEFGFITTQFYPPTSSQLASVLGNNHMLQINGLG